MSARNAHARSINGDSLWIESPSSRRRRMQCSRMLSVRVICAAFIVFPCLVIMSLPRPGIGSSVPEARLAAPGDRPRAAMPSHFPQNKRAADRWQRADPAHGSVWPPPLRQEHSMLSNSSRTCVCNHTTPSPRCRSAAVGSPVPGSGAEARRGQSRPLVQGVPLACLRVAQRGGW